MASLASVETEKKRQYKHGAAVFAADECAPRNRRDVSPWSSPLFQLLLTAHFPSEMVNNEVHLK